MTGGWSILLLLVPGFFVGWLFDEYPKFMRKLFDEAPVTMIAGCTIVGSAIVWVVLTVLGIW